MQIDWFTFVAQIVNFLILIWLLKKFLFGPVQNVMKKRENEINSRLEEAKNRLEEAEKKADEYQTRIEEFDEQKEDLMKEARKNAESQKKELIRQARSEVEKLSEKWKESVQLEKDSFLNEFEKKVFQKILDVVEDVISDLAGGRLEEQAINKFLENIKRMNENDRTTLSQAARNSHVTVHTAFKLQENAQKRISEEIENLVSEKTECRFETDSSLGFGIELRTNGWKLGWSMKSYVEDMLTELDNFLEKQTEEKPGRKGKPKDQKSPEPA
jgi:F-type H+-transporting ATPase subunit b